MFDHLILQHGHLDLPQLRFVTIVPSDYLLRLDIRTCDVLDALADARPVGLQSVR